MPTPSIPPYSFEYDLSVTMPMKVSRAKDFWGYYNGAGNTTLLPNLDYFDYFHQEPYKALSLTLSYPYVKANRYSDNSKVGAYMLKKVVYPTKGYTSFEYEPNTFTNQFIPDQSAPFNKSIDVSDNSVNSSPLAFFKLSRAANIHFENRIGNGEGNPNNEPPLTYAQMQGCYIELTKVKLINGSPQITVVKRWDLSSVLNVDFQNGGGKTWSEDLRVEYDPDPNPYFNYRLEVMYPDDLNNSQFLSVAGVSSHITYQDDTGVDITTSKTGGIRIARIKSYADDQTLASDKKIQYYGGKLLSPFRPLTVYEANHLDNSGVVNGNGFEYIALFRKITVSGNDFGMGGGPMIGYDRVEEIELTQGSPTAGKQVFYYNNVPNITRQGCFPILNQRNGLIAREEVYNNSDVKLQEKVYTYSVLGPFPPKFSSFSVVRLSTGSKVPCGNTTSPTPFTSQYYTKSGPYMTSQYGYNITTLNAEWHKLTSVENTRIENGVEFSTTVAYTYDAEGKRKTETTTNSKSETLETRFFYPTDHISNTTYDNLMISFHQTAPLVKVESYKNSEFLSSQRTFYSGASSLGGLWPQHSYTKVGTNPEERRLTIDKYDDKGNVIQYTEADNIPFSIVWNSDKTLPVAKVENATYASLLALPGGLSADFRTALPNARVTTYEYKPLVGVTSITDPNNKSTYFEYDPMGRLRLVRDWQNNILKKICYNYYGQVENCTACSSTTANWQNTATAIRCRKVSGVNTSEREQEQKDLNTCSSTYNQLRWTVVDINCTACAKPQVWQATGNLRCVKSGRVNTGNQEREERNVESCSSGYNTLRWVLNGYNTVACPVPAPCGNCLLPANKCINNVCVEGIKVYTGVLQDANTGMYTCVYHYEYPDGTWSETQYDLPTQYISCFF